MVGKVISLGGKKAVLLSMIDKFSHSHGVLSLSALPMQWGYPWSSHGLLLPGGSDGGPSGSAPLSGDRVGIHTGRLIGIQRELLECPPNYFMQLLYYRQWWCTYFIWSINCSQKDCLCCLASFCGILYGLYHHVFQKKFSQLDYGIQVGIKCCWCIDRNKYGCSSLFVKMKQ